MRIKSNKIKILMKSIKANKILKIIIKYKIKSKMI